MLTQAAAVVYCDMNLPESLQHTVISLLNNMKSKWKHEMLSKIIFLLKK